MPVDPIPTPSAPPVAGPYSPAVRAGDWIVMAGQIGIDATGTMADGVEAQTRQILANIGAVLGGAEASWADVAKTTIFLTDLGNFQTVSALYSEAIGPHRPARSTVGVAALPGGAVVEIECWVHQPA
ncbi:MAG: Rid family detoxifying hydrolase [Acidimicrobiia bacterium]